MKNFRVSIRVHHLPSGSNYFSKEEILNSNDIEHFYDLQHMIQNSCYDDALRTEMHFKTSDESTVYFPKKILNESVVTFNAVEV